MNGILLDLGQEEGFLGGELCPFCRIAFGIAGGAFFNDALKAGCRRATMRRAVFLFFLFFGFFTLSDFGRPASGVKPPLKRILMPLSGAMTLM